MSKSVELLLPQVLKALLDRLRNDITRLTAVKAFATIARSPLNIDLSPGKACRYIAWKCRLGCP
jgi:hypothetical protein